MKKIIQAVVLAAIFISVQCMAQPVQPDPDQDSGTMNSGKAGKKNFYGGVAFSYLATDCELNAYSSSNRIDEEVFDWKDWPEDEISDFNTYVNTSQSWMSPSLMFGMRIIDNPENRWSLTGEAMLGYLLIKHLEEDKNTGATMLEVKNDGKINVSGNLSFVLKYALGNWFVAINPVFAAGVAHSEHIDYNYLPEGGYDTKYEISSAMYYPEVNLSGGYTFGNFDVYAGAGWGAFYNRQNLEITKSTEYQTFGDDIKIDFKGESHFNALAGFDWLMADKFLWKVKAEYGIGMMGQTSFAILF